MARTPEPSAHGQPQPHLGLVFINKALHVV